MARQQQSKNVSVPGLSLVEILIAMALMGFVMLSISNFVIKSNVNSSSLSMRFKEASEIHAVVQDIQADLHRGAYFSRNSFDRRLEYTTYDPVSGAAVKKVYGICYYNAVQTTGTDTTCAAPSGTKTIPYLKLSTDGGATWGSPYRVSGFNKYRMITTPSTPLFFYAHAYNDCRDLVDDNKNGVWLSGESYNSPSCGNSAASGWWTSGSSIYPDKMSKVILANFTFTTGTGSPEALRGLPPYIFIAAAPGLVRSTMAAVSPGVKDSMLVQSFSTDPAVNVQFPSGFVVRGLAWDSVHETLLLSSESNGKVFRTERDGVGVNFPLTFADSNIRPRLLYFEDDGSTIGALMWAASTFDNFYRFNLSAPSPLQPTTSKVPMAGTEVYRWAMAYDPNTPDYFYIACNNSGRKITQYNKYTGVKTGTTWSLPAAFSSDSYIGGMFIEPVTGNFYIVRNLVYTAGGRKYLDVYKILRSNGNASLDFSIDLSDLLDSTATGSNGYFQMAYDQALNRIFLADTAANKVYEISPPKIISPRN